MIPGAVVPVTIVGGFLGAGKTTMVNHLLRTATRRYAVLVNDFGAVNVDAALIKDREGGVMSLANGCVCCSIGPDLGDTLARLLSRDPAPEHVLLEASGVSDPWRIAQLVKLEPALALDAVLVLVDAASFPDQLADRYLTDTLERQLARADLIVLNKCDLAEPGTAEDTVLRLRPGARIARVERAELPEALLAGPPARPVPGSRFTAEAPTHAFRTWLWRNAAPFDRQALADVLDGLPPSVLRAKGFCRIAPGRQHLLQLVGRRWSLTPAEGQDDALVVIGTELMQPEALDALFRRALLDAPCST